MKKLKTILLALVLGIGMVGFTGCNKNTENNIVEEPKVEEKEESKFDISKYTKEVETYTLEATNKKASLDVGFTKELDYTRTEAPGVYRLLLENSYNKVEVQFYNTKLSTSQAVAKREEADFDAEKTKDYKKLNINGNEGWQIYRLNSTTKKIMSYEAQIFFGEETEDGFVNAAKITINPNSTTEEGKNFNFEEFVKSDDFQYLLYSMKVK